jgi:hypothetical protein
MKIPIEILKKFERETESLDYGSTSIIAHVKQGKIRFVLIKEESFIYKTDQNEIFKGDKNGQIT